MTTALKIVDAKLPAQPSEAKRLLNITKIAIDYAAEIQDWEALNTAIEEMLRLQGELVAWWGEHVSVREKNRKLSQDRATVSLAEAEKAIKFSNEQISRWRKLLKNKDAYHETLFAHAKRKALAQKGQSDLRGASGTGENEWFTPEQYIALARSVLGGIDLDPATHRKAQKLIDAKAFFTKSDDGLSKEWHGRVWLNPPYAQPFIAQFASKMVAEVAAQRVTAAIMLTHNYTDTSWFHELAGAAARICFTRGRVRFYEPGGEIAAPTQGQAFFYFGNEGEKFADVFGSVGFVVRPVRVMSDAAYQRGNTGDRLLV